MMAQHVLPVFLQAARVRFFVNAINRRRALAHQARRHGFVGEQHVFLDQLVRHVVLVFLDAQNFSMLVQPDFHFRKIQLQRTILEALLADALGEFVRLMQHLLDGIVRRRALQNLQHLRVGEAALRMNDGGMKLRAQHAPIVRHEKFHALRQAIHIRFQRTQFVAQRFRQHRDDAVHEVS